MNDFLTLDLFKIYPDVILPKFETMGAACFDLRAYLNPENCPTIKSFWGTSQHMIPYDPSQCKVQEVPVDTERKCISLLPNMRYLIPTGIKMDIPEGYHVQILPRSSTGLKVGLSIPNSMGIIDSDYTDEVFLIFLNISSFITHISHEDRLAQGMLVKNVEYKITESSLDIKPKGDRTGGLGSTGK